MTALTFQKLFAPVALANAVGIIFTCPAFPSSACVKNGRVRFTNTTGGAVTVTAYTTTAAAPGNVPGPSNCFLNAVSIPANGYLDTNLPTLGAGDSFQAFASAAASITVSEIGGVIFT
jgi:hypothetical protein